MPLRYTDLRGEDFIRDHRALLRTQYTIPIVKSSCGSQKYVDVGASQPQTYDSVAYYMHEAHIRSSFPTHKSPRNSRYASH